MKKLFILLVLLVLSLSFIKTYADCPPGYTEHSYNATYTYIYPSGGGTFTCHVTVIYCCKWDNNLKTIVSEITEIRPQVAGDNCITTLPDDFMAWLHTETVKHAQESCQPAYPPCDDDTNPYYTYIVKVAQCWYYKNLILYEGDDIYSTVLRKCSLSFPCISKWRLCIDYNVTPPKLRKIFITKYPDGTPTCSTTPPTLPPSGKSWDEPWETGCFSTECN